MSETVPVIINHLQHIGIPVTNMPVSEAFYTRLGFSKVMQSAFELESKTGTCIMMKNNAAVIELYQLPDHKLHEIKSRADGHIDHIAFDVDDADATFAVLKNAGYQVLEAAPVWLPFWSKGCKYFNILGPDGERIEFNEIIR